MERIDRMHSPQRPILAVRYSILAVSSALMLTHLPMAFIESGMFVAGVYIPAGCVRAILYMLLYIPGWAAIGLTMWWVEERIVKNARRRARYCAGCEAAAKAQRESL